MKRKCAILAAVMLAAAMLLTSCGSFDYLKEDLTKYITLGDYNSIEYTAAEVKAVTDEDVENALSAEFDENKDFTEAEDGYAAADGDTVNIDYVGKINGEEFDGGADTGHDLELGSGSFIDGFESGLIGSKKGDKKSLQLKFPDDYHNEDLKGKDVVFEVTVNAVKTPAYTYSVALGDDDVLKDGDSVMISYTNAEGNEIETLTVSKVTVTVGKESKDIIKGLESKLAGLKASGEEQSVRLVLPDDFETAGLAGKETELKLTVEGGSRTVTTSVINDAMVAALTDHETAAEYKAELRASLEETAAKTAKKTDYSGLWKKVLDGVEVKEYPKAALKEAYSKTYDSIAGTIGSNYGVAMRDYAKMLGYSSFKQFKEEVVMEDAKQTIKSRLALYSVAKAENISLTDADKDEMLTAIYNNASAGLSSNYKTVEEFKEAYKKGELIGAFDETMLWEKVVSSLITKLSAK